MATPKGTDLARLAGTRIGETYANVLVPKNNPDWHGPWDCAEFVSWVVFQVTGRLYGCIDSAGDPAAVEAYSGSWVRDATNGTLVVSDQGDANRAAGVVLIRRPPLPGRMGHVGISDGAGKVIEAAGAGLGVRRGAIEGRVWDYCVRIPRVQYTQTGPFVAPKPLPQLLRLEDPRASGPLVRRVQRALKDAGINPGPIDGSYGPSTVAAVYAFQKTHRLVADGIVGPATAKKLRIEWP